MKTTILLLLGLWLGAASTAVAQRGAPNPNFKGNTSIMVQVRLKNGGVAPAGVAVTLEGEGSGLVGSTQTDSQGKASFHPPDAAYYVVSVRYPGYQSVTERVDLTTNPTAYLNIELIPEAAATPPGPKATLSGSVPENAAKEFRTGEKLLTEKRDPEGAIKHLQKATDIYKGFSEAYLMLGLIYLDQKKFEDSTAALLKATQLDGKSAPGYLALGAAFNQEKKYEEAEKALNRGLEINPDAIEGHYELAKTYLALGKWQEAEPHAQKTVSMKPDMAPAHVLLGNIALRKNDPEGALKEFKEYLRLDPQGPMAAGAQQMVSRLEQATKTAQ
jgi:tetratricopeptide (TPR) repeat protein